MAYENIPEDMKLFDQWVCWKYKKGVDKYGNPKKTKVPCKTNGMNASTTNPETWTTFEKAVKAVNDKIADGIGFVFTEECGIIGVDFDHVRTWDNKYSEGVLEELQTLNSYAELSPSETGIHVYLYGKKKGTDCKFKLPDKTDREIYDTGRFFTVTGRSMMSKEENIINESQEGLDAMYDKWSKMNIVSESKKKEKSSKCVSKSVKSPKMEDDDIINICQSAKNAEKFNKLFQGDVSEYNGDESAADQAFCNILAFYTQDPEQITRIVKTSGLYRDKWEREDYRERTIESAIKIHEEVYTGDKTKLCIKGDKPVKVEVPFDVIADHILKENNIFSMRDNKEIYLYKEGVYRSEGTDAILGTVARDLYIKYYEKYWEEANPCFPLDHTPRATTRYVCEVLDYIRAYTHITRKEVDEEQLKYINFKNCLFDIEGWKTFDHTPEIRIIGQFPVEYDPTATCPLIMDYMKACELTQNNIDTLTEYAGYCLTPDVRMQKALMLYGNGSNGKSVFINLLKIIFGNDYTSSETLQNLEEDKYRTANLYNKRLNAFPDLKDKPLQTNEVFNTLTGNDMYLTGERKYQSAFDFRPTTKLLFSANKIPFAYSDNYAYYRRWILIEFPHKFEKEEIDESLIYKLTTEQEKSGFLNMMLTGLKRLLENRKFSDKKEVVDVEKEYILHSDNVSVFEEQCCRDCSGNEEPTEKSLVYSVYEKWCDFHHVTPVKVKVFTKKMDKLGRQIFRSTKYESIGSTNRCHFACYFNTIVEFNLKKVQTVLSTN